MSSTSYADRRLNFQYNHPSSVKRRGVGEVILRAGVRGSGPRLVSLYERLGAEPFGKLYHIMLSPA